MGFLGSLFRTGKLNADLEQQALARALMDSVEHNRGFAKEEVFKYWLGIGGLGRSREIG
jgi:hypothetical protein